MLFYLFCFYLRNELWMGYDDGWEFSSVQTVEYRGAYY